MSTSYIISYIILNYHTCHKIVHTGCGLFFHENCLSMYNVNVEIEEEVGDGGIDEDENGSVPPSKIKFRCPLMNAGPVRGVHHQCADLH